MQSPPVFRGTSLDSPVTKVGLPLIAVQPGVAGHLPGTACLVAPWFAMTARHVIEDLAFPPEGVGHYVFTQVIADPVKSVLPLRVHRVYYAQPYDIAFLHLVPAAPLPSDHVWACPRLELLPPRVGSRIAAFGYPRSRMRETEPDCWEVNTDATTATGTVLEIHHETRDGGTHPFPCFRTDARFDPGMSGGPVFNEEGHICGIICSNMPPQSADGEHASYVSTLWPCMGTMVDVPWDRYPAGTRYPVYEMAQARIINALHLDHVNVVVRPDGTQTVACRRYDR